MILACCIGIVGCGLTMIKSVTLLCVGRVIYGYAGGIISVAANRMVDEYVPLQLFSTYSPIFSFSLNVGSLIATFSAVVLPKDKATHEELAANESWRYIFGFPIVFFVIVIIGMLTIVRTDTPKFLLQKDLEAAKESINVIYEIDEDNSEVEIDRILTFMRNFNQKETSTVTLKETFVSPKYKKNTWINIFNVIFHELSGINIIFLFSN